jgi:hypothetical protein
MTEPEVRDAVAAAFHRKLIERGIAVDGTDIVLIVEDPPKDPNRHTITAEFSYRGDLNE